MKPALLLGMALSVPLAAQTGPAPGLPATADDSALARRHYEEALRRNPDDSRSVYRLARLTVTRDSAIALYQRYTGLEPDDPWGWMALGRSQLSAGRAGPATAAWDQALRLAPREPEIVQARAEFDAELGRYWVRAGRPRRAVRAFQRALAVSSDPDLLRRLQAAQALTRPAIEPGGRYLRDSDGNHTSRVRLQADLMVADGARLGLGGGVTTTGNDLGSTSGREGELQYSVRPGATTRLRIAAGLSRTDLPLTTESWTTATASARFRWTARDRGPVVELSGQRLPLAATPELAANQVVRNEARVLAEIPAGPVRLRGESRTGSISAPGESNRRWSLEGALVLPLSWRGEISLQGHRLGYRDSTLMGYFAPERVETIEAGSYFELGDAAPWTVAFDLGAGSQRIRRFGVAPGEWSLALRGWGFVTYALGPARAIQLELEGYNAPGSAVVATTPDWRSVSLALSLRWGI